MICCRKVFLNWVIEIGYCINFRFITTPQVVNLKKFFWKSGHTSIDGGGLGLRHCQLNDMRLNNQTARRRNRRRRQALGKVSATFWEEGGGGREMRRTTRRVSPFRRAAPFADGQIGENLFLFKFQNSTARERETERDCTAVYSERL